MAEIIKWQRKNETVQMGEKDKTGVVSIDKPNNAIKIRTGDSQILHIRGERLRELRDIINQVLNG